MLSGSSSGSPPLTRGIPNVEMSILSTSRFTPAHAGNTFRSGFKAIFRKVHPRSRGEYYKEEQTLIPEIGSPPLTRGIPDDFHTDRGRSGFTPAHAGNTDEMVAGEKDC